MLSEGRGPEVVYSSDMENFLLLIGGLAVVFYGAICSRCVDIIHFSLFTRQECFILWSLNMLIMYALSPLLSH